MSHSTPMVVFYYFYTLFQRHHSIPLGSIHRGMLNAYGRVDKGKLIALDREDIRRSCFGPIIGETFDHFLRIQNLLQNYSMGNAKSRNKTDDFRHEKIDVSRNHSIEINRTSSGNLSNESSRSSSISSSSSRSSSKNKQTESRTDDDSVQVVDTLLSNLLINSVLSALRAGNRCTNIRICLYGNLDTFIFISISYGKVNIYI